MRKGAPHSPIDRLPRWQRNTLQGVLLVVLAGCSANQAPDAAIEAPSGQAHAEPAVQAPPKSAPPVIGLTPNDPNLCKTIPADTLAGWMRSRGEMTPRTAGTCSSAPKGKTAFPLAGGLLAYAKHDLPGALVNSAEVMVFKDASPTEPSRYDGLEDRYPDGVEAVTAENGFVAKYVGQTGTMFVKLSSGDEVVDVGLSVAVNEGVSVGNDPIIRAGIREAQKLAMDDIVRTIFPTFVQQR